MGKRNPNMSYYIRILAGGYILYLGIQLISGYLKGEAEMNAIVLLASAIVFIIAGAYFAGSSILYLYRHRNDVPKEESVEETAGETHDDDADELTEQKSDAEEPTEQDC